MTYAACLGLRQWSCDYWDPGLLLFATLVTTLVSIILDGLQRCAACGDCGDRLVLSAAAPVQSSGKTPAYDCGKALLPSF